MWPKIKRFFTDEAEFNSQWDKWVTRIRFLLMTVGAAVAVPGLVQDAVARLVPPKYAPYTGVLVMGLGVWLRAGDKTPKNILELSQDLKPQKRSET